MFFRRKIKNFNTGIEPHEVFLDKLAHKEEEALGISEIKFEVPLKEKISYILFAFFLILIFVLFSKAFYFQVIQGDKMYIAAENNKGSATLVIPERGIIYDKNLKKLVSNSPVFDLVCDKSKFSLITQEIPKKVLDISDILEIDSNYVLEKLRSSENPEVLISQNLSHEKILVLESKISELEGCKIQQNTARDYFNGEIFSHLLGYIGRINKDEYASSSGYSFNDNLGKTGLEQQYESYLRGTPGRLKILKTATGIQVDKELISEPVPGSNLVLNIDAGLQQKIYESLEKSIKNIGAEKGTAIAMDPRNGAVLGLVSYPSYDNNLFSGGISSENFNEIQNNPNLPLFNRAVSAQYPVGSTIKPFEALGALQENLISPDKEINDTGSIELKSKYDSTVIYRFGGVKPHGWVDMRKALAVSSNVYFYTIGGGYGGQQGLGPTRIKKYLDLFGWGEKTNIDLPGEVSGLVPSPEWKQENMKEQWWDGDTYNFSIGQSFLKVTPLQVASAYSAIANGGTLYKPQIVSKIIESLETSKQPIKSFEPEILRSNFVDPKYIEIVKEGMLDCTEKSYGTATSLSLLPVPIAAKTGTAEIGREGYFSAWIATFAPYENPEIVFVVTIEAVKGLQSATIPVARDVLDWYFSK
jgi:penicillin-binding protein 2